MATRKYPFKHHCEACDYKCYKRRDFDKHLATRKHHKATTTATAENTPQHICSHCDKTYNDRTGLWRHMKKCQKIHNSIKTGTSEVNGNDSQSNVSSEPLDNNTNIASTEITTLITLVTIQQQQLKQQQQSTEQFRDILCQQSERHQQQMLQQQQQMKEQQEQHHKQLQELLPKLQQVTNINNNTTNNTSNKFNLNFFLNEQCKDAISIQTFIENLDIGIKELEHMGNVGYLQGMMTIMSNTLGAMDVYKRPVHCTDLKRETVYIKDGDTWKKDNANNDDLRRVINTVANVNYRNLDVWESQHPDAFESDTPDNIEYCKIAMESMGGYDNSDDKIAIKLNKLVKHVVREVYVK